MPLTDVPIAQNWHGLNRAVAPQNLDASESPDTTDARSTGKRIGTLGPRLGRTLASTRPYTILGLGSVTLPWGRFRATATVDGVWHAEKIPWPAPVSPSAVVTGWDKIQIRSLPCTGTGGATTHGTAQPVGAFALAGFAAGLILPFPSGGNFVYTAPAVTGGTIAGGVATLTVPAHGLSTGAWVFVNTGTADYDGMYQVTVTNSSHFTYVVTAGDRGPDVLTGSVGDRGASATNYSGELYIEGKVGGTWGRLSTQLAALTGTLTDIRATSVLDAQSDPISTTLDFDVYLIHGQQNSSVTVP